jgi:hypothetical protein
MRKLATRVGNASSRPAARDDSAQPSTQRSGVLGKAKFLSEPRGGGNRFLAARLITQYSHHAQATLKFHLTKAQRNVLRQMGEPPPQKK